MRGEITSISGLTPATFIATISKSADNLPKAIKTATKTAMGIVRVIIEGSENHSIERTNLPGTPFPIILQIEIKILFIMRINVRRKIPRKNGAICSFNI